MKKKSLRVSPATDGRPEIAGLIRTSLASSSSFFYGESVNVKKKSLRLCLSIHLVGKVRERERKRDRTEEGKKVEMIILKKNNTACF